MCLVCAFLLLPSAARADDGGFWDMLFHWDTKFSGYGTDFHLLCKDKEGKRVRHCEEWFKFILHPRTAIVHDFRTIDDQGKATKTEFAEIRHEFNLRVSLMHSYGERVPDAKLAQDDLMREDDRKVWAARLLAMYYFRVNRRFDVGGGAGFIPLFGEDVDNVWRGVATLSSVYAIGKGFYVRGELSRLSGTVTGENLGHPGSSYKAEPGWNASGTFGIDLRRIGKVRPIEPPGPNR